MQKKRRNLIDTMSSLFQFVRNHRKTTVLIFLAIVAPLAYFVRAREEPKEQYLYVIGSRADKSRPLDLSQIYTRDEEKRTKVRMVVQMISPDQLIKTEAELQNVLEALQRSRQRLTLFFKLEPPYCISKKVLRQAIDRQNRIKGDARVSFLQSIVPVRGPGLDEPEKCFPREPSNRGIEITKGLSEREKCRSLDDDFAYMAWNFHGIGLFVDDATLDLLKNCTPYRQTS